MPIWRMRVCPILRAMGKVEITCRIDMKECHTIRGVLERRGFWLVDANIIPSKSCTILTNHAKYEGWKIKCAVYPPKLVTGDNFGYDARLSKLICEGKFFNKKFVRIKLL